jgi:dipeptidyl aminopeptidase/acylaminoacyl peptidase
MRHLLRAGILLLAAASAAAQNGAVPVPANVTAEGLSPIPSSVAATFEGYAHYRRADLLGWHPSQRQILIGTAFGEYRQIHSVSGPGRTRTQLTFLPNPGVNSGAWFEPIKGSYFVFRRDIGSGAESSQLFRYDVATSAITMLTDGKSRYGWPVWSHRSGLIAVDSPRRNDKDRDLYVMDPTDPSTLRMVAQLEGQWAADGWTPDDAAIIVRQILGGEASIWRVDVKTGEKAALTPPQDGPAFWSTSYLSPDGRRIYAVSNRGGEFRRVWRGELSTGQWTAVTPETASVETFALSPDGRTLAVVFDRDASSVLELFDAASMKLRHRPKLGAAVLSNLRWRPNSRELALNLASLRTYGDVYSVSADTGAVERWTYSETGAFNLEALPEPEIIRWKSFDGLAISGVLYRPPARFAGSRPVVLNIHGGPDDLIARERPRFLGRSAYLLNELGVALIYPNVRGTAGFGSTFLSLDNGELRENAVKDIGALLDWVAQQPFLDESRVSVTGASYGGYMTYAVMQMYPDRIRCGTAISAISNFVSYLEQTEPVRQNNRRAEYGDERDPKMRAMLTSISPSTRAAQTKRPLLIVHGRNDTRVPVAQAEEMYRAVRANGVSVGIAIFEDEGHMFVSRANTDYANLTWIMFLKEHLLN